MKRVQQINTPRGRIYQTQNGTAELEWNPNFVNKWETKYSKVQIYVDSEVLRLSEPYIPLQTSMLIKSGILGTIVGSGVVQWIAPYAKRVYYSKLPIGRSTGALRGNRWFARMKADRGQEIVMGAQKIMERG